ncbi:hypothetical protein LTR78_006868 [Recurvomyces mirabilis]|uniref:Carboxylic ester hydrolase n=1 Tax=Recurvomyces mirabilis TaxID=574656 RepID=A0AAE0WKD1_9PEZI|nr:hypothetical protein LTR78_006868 [Recurvomyces mirabilis]
MRSSKRYRPPTADTKLFGFCCWCEAEQLQRYRAQCFTYYQIHGLNDSGVLNNVSFCQVYPKVSYGTGNDSLIFALWLPDVLQYERRFMAVGNGGMAGVIDYASMMTQLNSGYGLAVAGGNAGHLASDNNAGGGAAETYLPYLHDPAQVTAWIHNAISLFTPAAKAMTTKLSQAVLNFTNNAVVAACDTLDGVKDGLIEDPLRCNFDIESLVCQSTYGNPSNGSVTCLTPAQIAVFKTIYQGPVRSDNGSQLYPGFCLGSENQWLLQEGVLADAFSIPILQNLVYNDLSYNSSNFNWASDVTTLDAKAGSYIDEISPDLTSFRNRSGKMIVTQGWTDPLNAATWPIEHLEQVENFHNGDVSSFLNLFMVPGGGHCGAARYHPSVPATYHTVAALINWVERGQKPNHVLSTNPPDGSDRTRKLCPWPATTRYVQGDLNDWSSYVCE